MLTRFRSFATAPSEAPQHASLTPQQSKPVHRRLYKRDYSQHEVAAAMKAYIASRNVSSPPSITELAALHHIPRTTLRDYIFLLRPHLPPSIRSSDLSDLNAVVETVISTTNSGKHRKLIPDEVEIKMINWIRERYERALPVSKYTIRLKAKQLEYALKGIPITPENADNLASERWWRRMCHDYPDGMSIREGETVEWVRANATQPAIIDHFYSLLKHLYDTYHFKQHQVFGMDEVGIDGDMRGRKVVVPRGETTTSAHTPLPHVMMQKSDGICVCGMLGSRRVAIRVSGYRSHMSMLHICCASGISLPPVYVFKGKRAPHLMLTGAAEGNTACKQPATLLSVQVSTAKPKPRKRAPRKVESTFAVLLTHDEQRNKLHAAAQEKQQKQEKKDQNIRKKAEKRAETEKKKEEKKKEKRGNLSKRGVRLRNKENICPNIPTPDFDPYGT